MRRIVWFAFWIFLSLFLIRVFVFQVYRVDGFSMSSTLLPGDRLIVNKINTGTRMPNSILGLPGVDRAYLDAFRIPYLRLPGFRKFKRNDVVVFNDPRISDIPIDRSALLVSRIAGLPGDTVIILNKELYINRDKVPDSPKYRRSYRVVTDSQPIPGEFLIRNNLEMPILIADIGIYDVNMDSLALESLIEYPEIKTVRDRKQFFGDSSIGYFPYSSFFYWNRDQYGPLIVPAAGLEIDISLKNIDLYSEIIDIYEGNELIVDFSGVSINGKKADKYTFKKNYYFVMDDNRDNPNDTRILGFIPVTHLLGTSKRIIYSGESGFDYLDKSGNRRILKKID